MDIAFFDPDRSHADLLRSALESYLATEPLARRRRAAKYGVNDDDDTCCWPRGTTPDDVRAAYDERLQQALKELRQATPESDVDEDDGVMESVEAFPRVQKGWGGPRGDLATPPTSGDEEESFGMGKRKRGVSVEGGEGVKKMRVDTRMATHVRRLATPESSPKRKSNPSRQFARMRRAAGIDLYNTHSMTTRSKARKSRYPP